VWRLTDCTPKLRGGIDFTLPLLRQTAMAGRAKVRNPEAGGALEHDRAVLATSRHLKAHRHMRHALEENEDDFDMQFSMAASLAGPVEEKRRVKPRYKKTVRETLNGGVDGECGGDGLQYPPNERAVHPPNERNQPSPPTKSTTTPRRTHAHAYAHAHPRAQPPTRALLTLLQGSILNGRPSRSAPSTPSVYWRPMPRAHTATGTTTPRSGVARVVRERCPRP
jgi:hypothetical protein